MARKKATEPDHVGRVIHAFDQDIRSHRLFARKADERYRAYRGIIERRSEAATWNNKQHPPYILQVLETMVAGLIDPSPKWKVLARPRLAAEAELAEYRTGAEALELLLSYQADADHYAEKQRTIDLQCLITGLTVSKQYWKWSEGPAKRREQQLVMQHSPTGEQLGFAEQSVEVEYVDTICDDPTCEPVDVRDFIWHEAATTLDKALRVTHRLWYSFDELKRLERAGVYKNVDALKESQTFGQALADREQVLFQQNRTRDLIEVLEQWWVDEDGTKRVTSVGNRNVQLADKAHPFWHGEYPFTVCSAMPDLFRIPGISEVEVIQDIQEMIWTLKNQALDAIQLITNPVVAIGADVDDPDAYEFAPGERFIVDRPDQVVVIGQPQGVVQASLEAQQDLKNDLQNIPGAAPTLLGQVDPSTQTATEISLTTSLAQRRLAAKKSQFSWMGKRIGEQWLALNQQFIVEPRLIEIVGADGAAAVKHISPSIIQGRYHIAVASMDESLMRQERRSEKQAMLQVAVQAAPVYAAVGQPLNMKAFMEEYLEAFEVGDTDRFFSAKPQPQVAGQPQQGAPGGPQQPSPDGAPEGVTGPNATGAQSPSDQFSQQPAQFAQREGATTGGPVNVG
jgi:hypothetical protein